MKLFDFQSENVPVGEKKNRVLRPVLTYDF